MPNTTLSDITKIAIWLIVFIAVEVNLVWLHRITPISILQHG